MSALWTDPWRQRVWGREDTPEKTRLEKRPWQPGRRQPEAHSRRNWHLGSKRKESLLPSFCLAGEKCPQTTDWRTPRISISGPGLPASPVSTEIQEHFLHCELFTCWGVHTTFWPYWVIQAFLDAAGVPKPFLPSDWLAQLPGWLGRSSQGGMS